MSSGIAKLLEDPDSMEKIKAMAASLFGSEKDIPIENSGSKDPLLGLDPSLIAKIGRALSSQENDSRSALLLALKPHLSKERGLRVDKAVKILKLVNLLPLIKDSGIF